MAGEESSACYATVLPSSLTPFLTLLASRFVGMSTEFDDVLTNQPVVIDNVSLPSTSSDP
jgi:hypothetical protein